MSRSVKKGPAVNFKLLQKVTKAQNSNDKRPIKTWARAAVITPEMVSYTFAVHNGHEFVPIFVSEDMVGHKLGEFAPTRTFKEHSGDRKTK